MGGCPALVVTICNYRNKEAIAVATDLLQFLVSKSNASIELFREKMGTSFVEMLFNDPYKFIEKLTIEQIKNIRFLASRMVQTRATTKEEVKQTYKIY